MPFGKGGQQARVGLCERLPGRRHDTFGVEPLIRDVPFDALLAGRAFDADWLRAELNQRGASAVIALQY